MSTPEITPSLHSLLLASFSLKSAISRAERASFSFAAESNCSLDSKSTSPSGGTASPVSSACLCSLSRKRACSAATAAVAALAAMSAISFRSASAIASPSARAFRNSLSNFSRSFSSRFMTLMFFRASAVSRFASSSSFCSISIASTC